MAEKKTGWMFIRRARVRFGMKLNNPVWETYTDHMPNSCLRQSSIESNYQASTCRDCLLRDIGASTAWIQMGRDKDCIDGPAFDFKISLYTAQIDDLTV